jgi:hypothetical protein
MRVQEMICNGGRCSGEVQLVSLALAEMQEFGLKRRALGSRRRLPTKEDAMYSIW